MVMTQQVTKLRYNSKTSVMSGEGNRQSLGFWEAKVPGIQHPVSMDSDPG